MQTSNLCSFEQAKKLKELGFDGECLYWYNEDGVKECPIEQGCMEYYYEVDCFLNDWNAKKIDRDLYGSYPPKVSYSAPTVSDALDWIREEKKAARIKFYVECKYSLALKDAAYIGIITSNEAVIVWERTEEYLSHPLASSALLDAVLTYLEQKEKP